MLIFLLNFSSEMTFWKVAHDMQIAKGKKWKFLEILGKIKKILKQLLSECEKI